MSSVNKNFDLQNTCAQTVIPLFTSKLQINQVGTRKICILILAFWEASSYNTFILNICFFGYVLKPLTWESRNTSELELNLKWV